jgi:hypothetical protein
MEIVLAVNEIERLRHVKEPVDERAQRERPRNATGPGLHPIAETSPGEILQYEVRVSILGTHIDDLNDVGVTQVDQGANLEVEPAQECWAKLFDARCQRALDHDLGLEMTIEGTVRVPHAADADTLLYQETTPGKLPANPVILSPCIFWRRLHGTLTLLNYE